KALPRIRAAVDTGMRSVFDEYEFQDKRHVSAFLDGQEALAKAGKNPATDPAVGDPRGQPPVSRFKVRSGVLLGTPERDSPVQGVLGKLRDGRLVPLCMNQEHAVLITGDPNNGKSSTT